MRPRRARLLARSVGAGSAWLNLICHDCGLICHPSHGHFHVSRDCGVIRCLGNALWGRIGEKQRPKNLSVCPRLPPPIILPPLIRLPLRPLPPRHGAGARLRSKIASEVVDYLRSRKFYPYGLTSSLDFLVARSRANTCSTKIALVSSGCPCAAPPPLLQRHSPSLAEPG